jgi:putative beta-1,4-xylosyltransferase IRX10
MFQEEKAIGRGILPLLQRATLVQTFGQKNHVCLKDGSITIPPYAPPQKMQAHLIPPDTPRSIFVYFRGLFYDTSNDPEGGYYARSYFFFLSVYKLQFYTLCSFLLLKNSGSDRQWL